MQEHDVGIYGLDITKQYNDAEIMLTTPAKAKNHCWLLLVFLKQYAWRSSELVASYQTTYLSSMLHHIRIIMSNCTKPTGVGACTHTTHNTHTVTPDMDSSCIIGVITRGITCEYTERSKAYQTTASHHRHHAYQSYLLRALPSMVKIQWGHIDAQPV